MAKKKPAAAPEKKLSKGEQDSMLATVADAVNKKLGAGTLITLDEVPATVTAPWQIATGSIGLDIAIGPMRRHDGRWDTGAIPPRMIEIYGPENTGKTTLVLQMLANAQRRLKKLGLKAAMIDVEHAVDPDYARSLGVDLAELHFSQPDSGDQAIEIVDVMLKSNLYGAIVVDSVASLITEEELAGDATDSHVGRQARLMSQSLKRFATHMGGMSDCPTVLVFTNQLRDKIGPFGGQTTPGGRALKFYANVRMEVKRIASIPRSSDDATPVGHRMEITVVKNKLFPPFRKADVPLYYGYGVERNVELAELCVARGVVKQSGSWYSHDGLDIKCQGLGPLVDIIRANGKIVGRQLYDELLTAVLAERGRTPEGGEVPGYIPFIQPAMEEQFGLDMSVVDIAKEVVERVTPLVMETAMAEKAKVAA